VIKLLLKILASLPVSTAEVERSFSCQNRILSFFRNSMECDRLSGLAMMSVYSAEVSKLDVGRIVDRFARLKSRRLEFL
jgi:hypothetical protein